MGVVAPDLDMFAFHLRGAGGAVRAQAVGAIENLGLVGHGIVDRGWVYVCGEGVACRGNSTIEVVELGG